LPIQKKTAIRIDFGGKMKTSIFGHGTQKLTWLTSQIFPASFSGDCLWQRFKSQLFVSMAVFAFALCQGAFAQLTTTTIYGNVADSNGAILPDAQVTATNTATNQSRTAKPGSDGSYQIQFLPAGTYNLDVRAPGFKVFEQKGITLNISQGTRIDAILQVGDVSQVISVTSAATSVNTENASIGRTVQNQEITDLPLVNRDVYTLLTLTPGVQSSQTQTALGYPQQMTEINGGMDSGNGSTNYFLDGGNNTTNVRDTGNSVPNPDAVQEFRVITNSYGAEYGRYAGGIITVLSKSGTNSFHGSVFEFLRNTHLNANTYGATSKVPLHRNQYGATVGGPIKKDKTFFFLSYSGLQESQSTLLNSAVVPTALERMGDFSQSAKIPINSATGLPYPNSKVPIDPTALNILNKYIPPANLPGNIFQAQVPNPDGSYEVLAKVDQTFSTTQQMSASYYDTSGHVSATAAGGNLPYSTDTSSWHQQNFNVSDTWTITPAQVNQLWLTYVRYFGGRVESPGTSLGDLGSSFNIQGPKALPQIAVTGYFTLGQTIGGTPDGSDYNGIRDTYNITHGRHSIKFGVEASLEKSSQATVLDNFGVFSFNGNHTGNALADFLTGLPLQFEQDSPDFKINNDYYYGLFLQDDFRVTPRLVLNLGLRYDLQMPITDTHDRETTYIAGMQSRVVPSAPQGLVYPGDPGIGRGTSPADKNNFGPRVGLAWDVFGNGKTSLRAAAGLFYNSVSANDWDATSDNQPFTIRQVFNDVQSLTNPYGHVRGGSPFPYVYDPKNPHFVFPARILGMAANFTFPYVYQLNTSIQHEFPAEWLVTAAYIGTLSHNLPFFQDINYPIYNATATQANLNNRRPIQPGILGQILITKPIMNATYNSLQITLEKKVGRKLNLKSYYTFSKTLDGAELQGATANGGVEDFNNLPLDRGLADSHRTHASVTSVIFRPDFIDGHSTLLRNTLNGWMVSSIITLESGQPFTVTSGVDSNVDGNNNDRPNLIGNPKLDPHRPNRALMWFDPKAFGAVAAGADGNARRNLLIGPGVRNVDAGLIRDFKIWRETTLQGRAECTNVFNMVSLGQPTAVLTSPIVGQIRSAGTMRQLQLGLRLTF
jgi:hypothetical protein